jgi:twitching motility protein PilU
MNIEQLLERVVSAGASDGFVAAGAPPSIKVDGAMTPIDTQPLSEEMASEMVYSTMNEKQTEDFRQHNECNFALAHPTLGRFRVSCFVQRGQPGLVLRRIVTEIPEIDELGLPPIIKELSMTKRGLVIFGQPVPVSPRHWLPWWDIAITIAVATSLPSRIRSNSCTSTVPAS